MITPFSLPTLDNGKDDIVVGQVLSEVSRFVLLFENLRLLGAFLLRQVLHYKSR